MAPIKKGAYDNYFVQSIQRIAEGKSTFKQEYIKLGTMAKVDLKKAVADWDSPRNAPFTIAQKGFDNPLIDSGLLYDSIDFKIDKRTT